jgi:hypothetical protein
MRKFHPSAVIQSVAVLLAVTLTAGGLAAQAQPSGAAGKAPAVQQTDNKDLSATQEELLKLLRMSPKLTTVIARDPSLLSNQEYVAHNNPALAQFLLAHPEVARNPDFYLFNNIGDGNGRTEQALERRVWPDIPASPEPQWMSSGDMLSFTVFLCVLGALLWLIRLLSENRRWNRIFKLQTEVHSKLIERFGTSQELLSYMGTQSGKRFLEAAPIPVDFERSQPVPSPVARVLTPLQIGIVLTLLGAGFLSLSRTLPQATTPLHVIGTLALTLGVGFIISAGVTWILARRLGLMPEADAHLQDRNDR